MRKLMTLAALAASALAFGVIGVSPASAFVLTVDLAGAGTGGVTSSPAGINCSNAPGNVQTGCSFTFPDFTTVTLSAAPGSSFIFRGWSGTAGGTCGSGSTNPCLTNNFLFSNVSATATFGPPPDPPLAVTEPAAQPVGSFSAVLRGRVNPNDFAVGNCYFELGTTTAYGRKVLCAPSDVGSGSSEVAVRSGSGTLKAGTTYHFRLVAKNVGGTRVGDDQAFTTAAYTENLSPLPGYGYELVSPPMTQGQRAKPLAPIPAPADDELFMQSTGGLPGSGWLEGLGATYVAQRGERGWKIVPISPSGVDYPNVGESSEPVDWTSDGQQTLWFPSLSGQQNSGIVTPVVRDRHGAEQLAGPRLIVPTGAVNNSDQYVGGSGDLRTLVFATRARPVLTGGVTDNRAANRETLIVVRRGSDGTFTVDPVAQRLGTAMFPTCDMELGESARSGLGAVSRDGRRIIFSPRGLPSCVSATQQRVWVKVDDDDPIDVSAPQCSPGGCSPTNVATLFEGASDDGTRVYFSTEQELLDGDGDTSLKRDLFEYTFASGGGGTLRAVTSSSTTTGAGVTGVSRVSADGSHVYFVANGQPLVTTQNARGVAPVLGDTNLYVYKRQAGDAVGTIAFVGKLMSTDTQVGGSGDANRTVQTSDDGRFFTFISRADVTGDRLPGDTQLDVFRYDAEQDDLRRLWSDAPEVNGAARTDGVSWQVCECGPGYGPRNKALRYSQVMSQDGAVIGFSTTEALDPRDQNTTYDGYVWTLADDAVHLVTSGRGNEFNDRFVFVSRSGNSIGVASATGLVPEHTSGQTGAYVLRKGGGFPPPDPDPVPCRGDGCQGGAVVPPVVGGAVTGRDLGEQNVRADAPAVPVVSVSAPKSVRGANAKAKVKVKVPGAGWIALSGSMVKAGDRAVSRAGTYTVGVRLTAVAAAKVRAGKQVRAKVRVAFKSAGGPDVSRLVTVTFKPAVKKKAAKKKKTTRAKAKKSSARSSVKGGR